MKRKQRRQKYPKRVDAILSADWHLRDTVPRCRTDDYWKAQEDKVKQIYAMGYEFGCPVFHAGDLFDHWKNSPYLINWCLNNLPEHFYTCIGNHDVPQHNIDNLEKCGLGVLETAKKIELFPGSIHWGEETTGAIYTKISGRKITLVTIKWLRS